MKPIISRHLHRFLDIATRPADPFAVERPRIEGAGSHLPCEHGKKWRFTCPDCFGTQICVGHILFGTGCGNLINKYRAPFGDWCCSCFCKYYPDHPNAQGVITRIKPGEVLDCQGKRACAHGIKKGGCTTCNPRIQCDVEGCMERKYYPLVGASRVYHDKYCQRHFIELDPAGKDVGDRYRAERVAKEALEAHPFVVSVVPQRRMLCEGRFLKADFVVTFVGGMVALIELDGRQHFYWTKYFQPTFQDFLDQCRRDLNKETRARELWWSIFRISFQEYDNIPHWINVFAEIVKGGVRREYCSNLWLYRDVRNQEWIYHGIACRAEGTDSPRKKQRLE